MTVTINGRTFQTKPFPRKPLDRSRPDQNRHGRAGFTVVRPRDPLGVMTDSNTAIHERLDALEWRKVYEYNCVTKRGSTFDLDSKEQLAAFAELHVFTTMEVNPNVVFPSPPFLDGKAQEAALKQFHDALGISPGYGKKGSTAARRTAVAKISGVLPIKIPMADIKQKHIPSSSFRIFAVIEFALEEVIWPGKPANTTVIISVPERVHAAYILDKHCHGELAETFTDVGKVTMIGTTPGLAPPPATREARDIVAGERKRRKTAEEDAERRRNEDKAAAAKRLREDLEAEKKALEERFEKLNKAIEDAKVKEKEAKEELERD